MYNVINNVYLFQKNTHFGRLKGFILRGQLERILDVQVSVESEVTGVNLLKRARVSRLTIG